MASYVEQLTEILQGVREEIVRNMDKYHRNASFRSVKSLRVQPETSGATLYGSKSFNTMESGRPPGRAPENFADVIFQWSKDKGIRIAPLPYRNGRGKYSPEDRARWQFARCVAHKIITQGTKLYRERGFDDIYSSAVNRAIDKAFKATMAQASQEVTKINNKF